MLIYLNIFSLEQEKASKVKVAKDKAYQEAVQSQQKQEEFNGFWTVPTWAPRMSGSQGKATIFVSSYVDYDYI